MQIAQVIGGYTLGGADLLRRAMGKKKPEEMATHRTIFVEGATKNGVPEGARDAALRPHGEVRRLRLQPLACRRLRAHRLPDGVVQGAPSGRVHGGQPVAGDGRHRQGAPLPRRRDRARACRCCRPTSTHRTTASSRWTRSRSATAWAASRAPARRRSRPSSPRARRAGRFAISSISAGAWTSAPSTGAPWKRWSAPARSTRSSRAARRCWRRSAWRSRPRSAPRPTPRRSRCSARRRRNARVGPRRDARLDRRRAAAERKVRRSGSTCPGIRSTATPRNWRRVVRTALVGPGAQATTACWSPASSRRCACRADGAARWPSSRSTTAAARRRSWSTTRLYDGVRNLLRDDQLVIAEVKVSSG